MRHVCRAQCCILNIHTAPRIFLVLLHNLQSASFDSLYGCFLQAACSTDFSSLFGAVLYCDFFSHTILPLSSFSRLIPHSTVRYRRQLGTIFFPIKIARFWSQLRLQEKYSPPPPPVFLICVTFIKCEFSR